MSTDEADLAAELLEPRPDGGEVDREHMTPAGAAAHLFFTLIAEGWLNPKKIEGRTGVSDKDVQAIVNALRKCKAAEAA